MRAGLELRLSQQLRLSPQLRQALKLLQMSQTELEIELREQLEGNPVLEMSDTEPDLPASSSDDSGAGSDHESTENPVDNHTDDSRSDEASGEDMPDLAYTDDDTMMDPEWSGSGSGDPDNDPIERAAAPAEDLQAHLMWQLQLTPFNGRDKTIAAAIIEALEPDGYLRVDNDEIAATVAPAYSVDDDEIETVRHRIQHFDPTGVASRDLRDCLLVQLDTLGGSPPGLVEARRLIAEHLDRLPRLDRSNLARQLGSSEEAIDAAMTLIRSLDPKPGQRFDASTPEYVQPDVYAVLQDGEWRVLLHSDRQHQLRINRDYLHMASRHKEARSYLRGCLQEARWLIKALEQRQTTLFRVTSAIVEAQRDFLDQGPQAMRPLLLKDIAAKLGLHESTISRTVARKYLHTPRGVVELRHFFSTGYSGGEGDGDAAATAVRALIGELIGQENPSKPLSDQAIAGVLKQRGLAVARRTVAKYREQLRIAPSHERRRA